MGRAHEGSYQIRVEQASFSPEFDHDVKKVRLKMLQNAVLETDSLLIPCVLVKLPEAGCSDILGWMCRRKVENEKPEFNAYS